MTSVIVYKYGLLEPLDFGPDCHQHLWLQNQLWNRLVEIENAARARYEQLFSTDPTYATIATELDSLQNEIDTLWRERQSARAAARNRRAGDAASALLKPLLARKRELWTQQKALRLQLRPAFTEAIRSAEAERRQAVKLARQQSGLWWGNYNRVCAAYERARSRALTYGGHLRFHPFDGSGQFRNQIMGGVTVEDLFAGQNSQVRVRPLSADAYTHPARGARRRLSRTALTVTIHTENGQRRMVTWPMIMHRPIWSTARIKEVLVIRAREGAGFRWSAIFVCTYEARTTAAPSGKPSAGINFGWRRDNLGVRVATVCDTAGDVEHIRLPELVSKRAAYIAELQSDLDARLQEMRERLAAWRAEVSFQHPLEGLVRRALQSRSAAPMARLALTWREHPDFHPHWCEALDEWRRGDKRSRNEMEHLRRKMFGLRRQHYEREAKRLAVRYGMIALGPLDLAGAARLVDEELHDTNLPLPARRMRQLAALSELVTWIQRQCAKSGAQLTQVRAAVTSTCHACGVRRALRGTDIVHRCSACGVLWDQDENAARNALNWAQREQGSASNEPLP